MDDKIDTSGTAQAFQGSIERIMDPDILDVIFPFFAFSMVVLIPAALAMWVIYKTWTEKLIGSDEN